MYPLHVSSFQADSYMMLFRSWTWLKTKLKEFQNNAEQKMVPWERSDLEVEW